MAAVTISSTERLCPRWITSAPEDWRMRRMMLVAASWPSKRLVAVTKRTLWLVLCAGSAVVCIEGPPWFGDCRGAWHAPFLGGRRPPLQIYFYSSENSQAHQNASGCPSGGQ